MFVNSVAEDPSGFTVEDLINAVRTSKVILWHATANATEEEWELAWHRISISQSFGVTFGK